MRSHTQYSHYNINYSFKTSDNLNYKMMNNGATASLETDKKILKINNPKTGLVKV